MAFAETTNTYEERLNNHVIQFPSFTTELTWMSRIMHGSNQKFRYWNRNESFDVTITKPDFLKSNIPIKRYAKTDNLSPW